MNDLQRLLNITKKANQTSPIRTNEFWEQQNKSIAKLHKEFDSNLRELEVER